MGVILKRFEIWLLFALVAGAIWFAFRETEAVDGSDDPETPSVEVSDSPEDSTDQSGFQVAAATIEPSAGGSILNLSLTGKSQGTEQVLTADNVRVLSETGDPLDLFFEPFQQPSSFIPEETSTAKLRFWVPGDAPASYSINYQGETREITPTRK
ncbi:MAG: hypothetical protein AAF226_12680 [Verrucomicrobiota bacterium]